MRRAAQRVITEVKRKGALGGGITEQRFELELWLKDVELQVVVGCWRARAGQPCFGLAPGSSSWGVWPLHPDACWGAYRIHDESGALQKYRFDCLENVHLAGSGSSETIAFDDLVLDAELDAGASEARFLDEDELSECLRAREPSAEQKAHLARFRHEMLHGIRDVKRFVDEHIERAQKHQDICTRRQEGARIEDLVEARFPLP